MPCVWSPLPPSRSPVARYADAVYGDVRMFPDLNFVVFAAAEARRPRAVTPFDPRAADRRALLQIADDPLHDFVFGRAMRGGCVVEMHDIHIRNLVAAAANTATNTAANTATNTASDRRTTPTDRRGSVGGRYSSVEAPDRAPPVRRSRDPLAFARSVAQKADAIIVHSQWARSFLEDQGRSGPIHVVPRYAESPVESPARARGRRAARRSLNVAEAAFLILVEAGDDSFLEIALAAIARHAAEAPDAEFVILGSSDGGGVARRAAQSPARRAIRLALDAGEAEICEWVGAADIVCAMRRPPRGDDRSLLSRAIGFGRAAVALETAIIAEGEDRFVETVRLDERADRDLALILSRWRGDPAARRSREREIASFARRERSLTGARAQLRDALDMYWR